MKKSVLLLISLAIFSCSDDFLELYPKTSLNEGNFYSSENEFVLLTNGCYTAMRDYERGYHWVVSELRSDNASFQYNSTESGGIRSRGVFDLFLVDTQTPTLQPVWNLLYRGIYNCNRLLVEIDENEITWSNEAIKERSQGEALFLRALYYFNLVRQFGGVPIVLSPVEAGEAVGIKRSSEEEVYNVIVDDLEAAIAHFEKATEVEEKGRANWGAAASLLGKVFLTMHQYPEAEGVLDDVIASGRYDLLSDYAQVFDPSSKDYLETIFAVQYSENSAELANQFIFLWAPWSSGGEVTNRPNVAISQTAGWNQPTDDLINAFEPGDLRKDVSINYWFGPDWDGVERNIPYPGKFKPPVSAPDNRSGDNFPILRYSDVLLMYAEVLNELGRPDEAFDYVRQVRTRAGLTTPTKDYTKEELFELIMKERQTEFCFENQRWYDLKRTGKAVEVMKSHATREKASKEWLRDFFPAAYDRISENRLVIPIPVQEIDINNLKQNPGY